MDVLSRLRLLLWAFALVAVSAQAQQVPEPAVKAAFLYKFAGYVEWPPGSFDEPDAPLVIGVIGANEVAAELERIVPGRAVNNRRVAVRRLLDGEALHGVHVLFVGRREPNLRNILRAAQKGGVLTVTESEHGFEAGSSINFVSVDDRVGFEVSLQAAERSGLRISSRMLTVARRVVPRS